MAAIDPYKLGNPLSSGSLDHIGPLSEINNGNKHVLVLMDHVLNGARLSLQKIKRH